ncbi:MAG: hypothetical protein ABFS32_12545 [Bacteroidota bacterium]
MKHLLFALALFVFAGSVQAQIYGNDPEIEIDGLSQANIWQVIEMALIDNNFGTGKFNPTEGYLYSDWFQWKSIAITNHARTYYTFDGTTMIIHVVDRAYKSDEGWSEAIGNLSKKNYKKYVQVIADRVNEIKSDDALVHKAIKTSKLVPAFNAINMVGDIEFKLLEAAQTEENRPVLKYMVSNKGSKKINLTYQTGEFENLSGVGKARLRWNWEKAFEDNQKQTALNPGESMTVESNVGQGYSLQSAIGYVMDVRFEYDDGQKKIVHLKIYNIPIPYTYQKGD